MHDVTPKVFLIVEPQIIWEDPDSQGLTAYLEHVGAPEWETDARSEAEGLIEVMGRLCYRSFAPGLNANVTKVREGNKAYINNILKVKHGSVLEHASISFIFADVSRVFTHELVRHRPGIAISQESLRFVRLTELGQWLPTIIREDTELVEIFTDAYQHLETLQLEMAKHIDLDNLPFSEKKVLTSAMRRIAPMGLATSIGWSCNFRTLRWLLELRTHPSAEEEIRMVFGEVGRIVTERYPHVFGDYDVKEVDGHPQFIARNQKV